MRTFIAGAAVVVVIVLLVGAHLTGAPKSLSQIPLTQAFRVDLGKVGGFEVPNPQQNYPPFRLTLPKGTNLAITEVRCVRGYLLGSTTGPLPVRVNGIAVFRAWFNNTTGAVQTQAFQLDPPILVPELGTIEIGMNTDRPDAYADMLVAGYYLTPEDLGK